VVSFFRYDLVAVLYLANSILTVTVFFLSQNFKFHGGADDWSHGGSVPLFILTNSSDFGRLMSGHLNNIWEKSQKKTSIALEVKR
jgi:hypothetical protein